MDILMETIKVQERTQLKALEWALNEITDNVLNHAESPIGGLVQIQSFPSRSRVTFYVADAGLGISHSRRQLREIGLEAKRIAEIAKSYLAIGRSAASLTTVGHRNL
jgi:anti-sigma regulatory factor (Ser/Thr protein kinase)